MEDITAMTPQRTKIYLQAMERIKARERLFLMDAAQYPHLQPKDKKTRHKKLYREAYPENFEERTVKTTDLELF